MKIYSDVNKTKSESSPRPVQNNCTYMYTMEGGNNGEYIKVTMFKYASQHVT
jgi:hypothetical protein